MALGLISLIEFGADGGVFASGTGTTPLDEAKDPAISNSLALPGGAVWPSSFFVSPFAALASPIVRCTMMH